MITTHPASQKFVPCMVKDPAIEYCLHKDCKFLHKHPICYFERPSEKIRQHQDFTYFEMHTSYAGRRWIMPVNPYAENTPERNKFELFRQGWGEMRIVGSVPNDRVKFHRDEISYKYTAVIQDPRMISEYSSIVEVMEYEVVDEVAYFNGPI